MTCDKHSPKDNRNPRPRPAAWLAPGGGRQAADGPQVSEYRILNPADGYLNVIPVSPVAALRINCSCPVRPVGPGDTVRIGGDSGARPGGQTGRADLLTWSANVLAQFWKETTPGPGGGFRDPSFRYQEETAGAAARTYRPCHSPRLSLVSATLALTGTALAASPLNVFVGYFDTHTVPFSSNQPNPWPYKDPSSFVGTPCPNYPNDTTLLGHQCAPAGQSG